ncbi:MULTISPECIES: pyridoxamine 5'-phosphate oxidase family protein [unclassified Nocardioides]|uniref:pyridoxamine 5'-phosphate oxidase family protein n=1 Tax=unclassified Nocardioides TaxID=2615069 RepID=UPI0036134634
MATTADDHLTELSDQACWDLLRSTQVGRIAWTTADGPVVLPVNHVVDGRSIRIRTRGGSALVQKVDLERVAFEVDRIDEATHRGWSVLARGRAAVRYGDDAGGSRPNPWPSGPRSAVVTIAVDAITGRRLGPTPG